MIDEEEEPDDRENDCHPDKNATGTLVQFRDALRSIVRGSYGFYGNASAELNYVRGIARAALDKEADDAPK